MNSTLKTLDALNKINKKARAAWQGVRAGDPKARVALAAARRAARRRMLAPAVATIDLDSPVLIMHAGRVIGVVTMSRPEVEEHWMIPEVCGRPVQYGDPSFLSQIRAPRASFSAGGTIKVPETATPREVAALAFEQEWTS